MYHIDNNTVLNSTAKALENHLGPHATEAQLTQNVLNQIQKGRRVLKPFRPRQLCMYPNQPKRDDFNINEGLGNVSLQPIIDHLNNLKKNIIREIKTKLQAMGPENSKDTKLAAGAVEIIQEVYNAAKCFSQIVTNVNNTISAYIQGCNVVITQLITQINTLTTQVNMLKRMLLTPSNLNQLEAMVGKELVQRLNKETAIFDMLGIVNDMVNVIESTEKQLNSLANTDKKLKMHLKCSLMAFKTAMDGLNRALSNKAIVESNIEYANNLIMEDDYLNDFYFTEDLLESSFNWSITNHNSLSDYSTIDEYGVLNKADSMFKTYITSSRPILIQSRSQSGYIVVPDGTDGLITLGVDKSFPSNVMLTLELSINDGETVIIAKNSSNNTPDAGELIKINRGEYISEGANSFEYIRSFKQANGTYRMILNKEKDASEIKIGTLYTFIDPMTSDVWCAKWTNNTTGKVSLIPYLYKVIEVNLAEVILERQDSLPASRFFSGNQGYTYSIGNTYDNCCFPGINGDYGDSGNGEHYPYTVSGDIPNVGTFYSKDYNSDRFLIYDNTQDSSLSYTKTSDPYVYNLNNDMKITSSEFNILTMKKYEPSSLSKIPHANDKIKCKNWTLNLYVAGDQSSVNKLSFNKIYPTDNQSIVAMKAHWGFIPDTK